MKHGDCVILSVLVSGCHAMLGLYKLMLGLAQAAIFTILLKMFSAVLRVRFRLGKAAMF